MMEEMKEQLISLIEPTGEDKTVIMDYLEKNNIVSFMENYEELNLSDEAKDMVQALKIILDASEK